MSEKKYYVHPKRPFGDGTAYIERSGRLKVCVSLAGVRSVPSFWSEENQNFADTRAWIECDEGHAKSLVKASATSSESKGDS